MKIGVLAIQGDFAEHITILHGLGVKTQEVRLPYQLDDLDGLIIPGGESTTLSRLMSIYELREPIQKMASDGKAIWGTCAGMIMMASEITEKDPIPLRLMDITVIRNAFGRQIDSFEQDLTVKSLDPLPYHAIFIRAPIISRVGLEVEVLATLEDGRAVAVQQKRLLATSFHPELTKDSRLHDRFVSMASYSL
ncbi:MAG: pyridoxal 5'-phosphate synthase glutaminase subunit PdxT [Chloroflexi bacterium]|nr:pyridoxal 5'-phosphate synthase glutaminase subunit PdxT [Chloroflexota bacterium]